MSKLCLRSHHLDGSWTLSELLKWTNWTALWVAGTESPAYSGEENDAAVKASLSVSGLVSSAFEEQGKLQPGKITGRLWVNNAAVRHTDICERTIICKCVDQRGKFSISLVFFFFWNMFLSCIDKLRWFGKQDIFIFSPIAIKGSEHVQGSLTKITESAFII